MTVHTVKHTPLYKVILKIFSQESIVPTVMLYYPAFTRDFLLGIYPFEWHFLLDSWQHLLGCGTSRFYCYWYSILTFCFTSPPTIPNFNHNNFSYKKDSEFAQFWRVKEIRFNPDDVRSTHLNNLQNCRRNLNLYYESHTKWMNELNTTILSVYVLKFDSSLNKRLNGKYFAIMWTTGKPNQ